MFKRIVIVMVLLCLFLGSASAMGWQQDARGWWYENGNGSYPIATWQKINNKWYYFDNDGYMVTGFQEIGGSTYYFEPSGAMATGWQQIGNDWYEFSADGTMIKNQWSGEYYLDADGKMLTDTLTPDGYYVGSSGIWVAHPGCDYRLALNLIGLINAYRAENGLAPMSIDERLCRASSYVTFNYRNDPGKIWKNPLGSNVYGHIEAMRASNYRSRCVTQPKYQRMERAQDQYQPHQVMRSWLKHS